MSGEMTFFMCIGNRLVFLCQQQKWEEYLDEDVLVLSFVNLLAIFMLEEKIDVDASCYVVNLDSTSESKNPEACKNKPPKMLKIKSLFSWGNLLSSFKTLSGDPELPAACGSANTTGTGN